MTSQCFMCGEIILNKTGEVTLNMDSYCKRVGGRGYVLCLDCGTKVKNMIEAGV